jgi:DNA-binding MltR family transcriptional regulator
MSPDRVVEIERLLAQARSPKLREELLGSFKELGSLFPAEAFPPGVLEVQVELFLETDRGCVLVGAAFLDDLLAKLLRAAMRGGSETVAALLKPGKTLGDFMDRARTAYAFGLIGNIEYSELDIIAQIRNKCAHLTTAHSFEWSGVADLTSRLRCPILIQIEETPRRRFVASASIIGGCLIRRISETKHAPDRDESGLAKIVRPKATAK